MKVFNIFLFLIVFSVSLIAAEGPSGKSSPAATAELSGMVVDKYSGEALGGVEITIEGTDKHYYTDFDGKFEISDLAPGTYDLIISYISYEKSLIEKLELNAGNKSSLDVQLISAK